MAHKFLVKICGLKTAESLAAALDAGADMVGFVFFGPSPRNVSLSEAADLARLVKGRAKKVALTVTNAPKRLPTWASGLSSVSPRRVQTPNPMKARPAPSRIYF